MRDDHLLDWLEAFNRKERYYLIAHALGGFALSDAFRSALGSTIGRVIPPGCSAWMDYHLDWVHAAITLSDVPLDLQHRPIFESPDFRGPLADAMGSPVYINQSQEDIDLLVAFEDAAGRHMVFVEAKGETSWSNRQMSSKVARLATIFAAAPADVLPAFVLVSPRPPRNLTVPSGAPPWLAPDGEWRWMALEVPPGRWEIVRWDAATGRPSESARTWRPTPSDPGDR